MYRGGIILAVIVVALAVTVVVVSATRRRERRWEEAKQSVKWEVSEYTYDDGDTQVNLVLVARAGRRMKVYRTTRIGTADISNPDWEIELEILRERAQQRADVLNQARNKGGDPP